LSLDELIGIICYWYMKRVDPEWTRQAEEKYGLREDEN